MVDSNKNDFFRLLSTSLVVLLLAPGLGIATASVEDGGFGQVTKTDLSSSRTEELARRYKLTIQTNPLDSEAHFKLGCLLAKEGETAQAIMGFHQAVMIDPTHPEALYNLGTLLLDRGDAVAAAELLEESLEIRPDYIPAYNNLAKAYYVVGLPELAVATYREALSRDPDDLIARDNLARLGQSPGLDGEELASLAQTDTPAKEAPAEPAPAGTIPSPVPLAQPLSGFPQDQQSKLLQDLLGDLPYVDLHMRAGSAVLSGWTRGPQDRELLDRMLAGVPNILDLTTSDVGDNQRMIEVDAIMFVLIELEQESIGFNFLDLIQMNFAYFATDHHSKGSGFDAGGVSAP